MKSKRLEAVASLVEYDDKVIDVGCDHGYLSIYLYEKHLCSKILATDVNEKPLAQAKGNIARLGYPINVVLSDGLNDIEIDDYNTLVVAGMGAMTIMKILANEKVKKINKLILESNNNQEKLRDYVVKLGFYLNREIIVLENDKYYEIMEFVRSNKINTALEIEFGIINRQYMNYYQYLINKYTNILNNLPSKDSTDYLIYQKKVNYLKTLIEVKERI